MQKTKKILCIALICATIITLFAGCGGGVQEAPVPVLVPEKQLMNDKYERNSDISENLTYQIDYMHAIDDIYGGMQVAMLFKHTKIQIDGFETLTLGVSTLGEIVEILGNTNKKYVEDQTKAVIDARQAQIDEEYNKLVEEAEKKGKTYDKPKKEVRTDDIHFDEPYQLKLAISNGEGWDYIDYQATLLVDPTRTGRLTAVIFKYGIQYATLEFQSVDKLYNFKIKQESDWVFTGIVASNVSAYTKTLSDGSVVPMDFVDADGRNKAAKQNIYMSGDIAFGGEGFTWDSLMVLCDALSLVEGGYTCHSFTQTSDEKFTYYTITWATDPFELGDQFIYEDGYVAGPVTQLVATFDRLTQVCLNWRVDMHSSSTGYNNVTHDLSDSVTVNVHKYQVDTNDYERMRRTLNAWLTERETDMIGAYCVTDKDGKYVGIVESGLNNIALEITVDGKQYACLEYHESQDHIGYGTYISNEDLDTLYSIENQNDADKFQREHVKAWTIDFYALKGNTIVEAFDPAVEYRLTDNEGNEYYMAKCDDTDSGFRNVTFISADNAAYFISFCTKTYKLNAAQHDELRNILEQKGIPAIRKHIDSMFKDAEEAQKNEGSNNNKTDKLLAEKTPVNTEANIGAISFGGQQFDISSLKTTDIVNKGYEDTKTQYYTANLAITLSGNIYKSSNGSVIRASANGDQRINTLMATDSSVRFYKGIYIGMDKDDMLAAVEKSEKDLVDKTTLVLKSEKNTLVIRISAWASVVEEIFILNNDQFEKNSTEEPDQNTEQTPQQPDINTNVEEKAASAEANTDKYLAKFSIDGIEFNITNIDKEALKSEKIKLSNLVFTALNEQYLFAGVKATKDGVEKAVCFEFLKNGCAAVYTESEKCIFADVYFAGMKRDEVKGFHGDGKVNTDGDFIVIKNSDHTLVLEMKNDVVASVCLIQNDRHFN